MIDIINKTLTPIDIIKGCLIHKKIEIRQPGNQEKYVTLVVADVEGSYDWEWRGFKLISNSGNKYDVDISDDITIL